MPSDSLEVVMEMDMDVAKAVDNGMDKDLDMDMGHTKLSSHKKKFSSHTKLIIV